jgi:hypothetical protein
VVELYGMTQSYAVDPRRKTMTAIRWSRRLFRLQTPKRLRPRERSDQQTSNIEFHVQSRHGVNRSGMIP